MLPISSTTIFGQLNAACLGMFYFEQIFSLNTKTNFIVLSIPFIFIPDYGQSKRARKR